MTHAYNCTRHDSTGYTPYFLMYGQHPRLPVDLAFGLASEEDPVEYSEYAQILHDCFSFAYDQANHASRSAKEQQKQQYDHKARDVAFQPGDWVLVRMTHVEGRQKLADQWESMLYMVVKKQSDIPVYIVRSEDGQKEQVVHRNLLTQCMFLPWNRRSQKGQQAEPPLFRNEAADSDVIDGESVGDVIVFKSSPRMMLSEDEATQPTQSDNQEVFDMNHCSPGKVLSSDTSQNIPGISFEGVSERDAPIPLHSDRGTSTHLRLVQCLESYAVKRFINKD
ncbi:uncharacterized protein LOC106705134 [Latimeria chalumnae]|uniref:uncharacterized protein LOC106705134 n=1 Tax=Latimeria chalumnae TaxID=7897 RepID=UPI0006D8FC54|nr:PREDICTED: uncharacterized protein LOC106705134 [Latimeria chalumnae]|eukprot:XP_014349287.1 PREDICTED: uncharacterized protein LOC106705134 [Latimeria chalumnae]